MSGNACVCKHQKKQPNKAKQLKAWSVSMTKNAIARTAFPAVKSRNMFFKTHIPSEERNQTMMSKWPKIF